MDDEVRMVDGLSCEEKGERGCSRLDNKASSFGRRAFPWVGGRKASCVPRWSGFRDDLGGRNSPTGWISLSITGVDDERWTSLVDSVSDE